MAVCVAALAAGAPDNVTVVVARIRGVAQIEVPAHQEAEEVEPVETTVVEPVAVAV